MPKIKTGDAVKGTIKQLDKAAMVGDRMRTAYVSTKEKAEQSVSAAESNPEEYASGRVETTVDRGTHEAVHQLDKAGRKSVKTTKDNIVKAKDKVQQFKEKRTADNIRKQARPYRMTPTSGVTRTGTSTAQQTGKTVKQSARSTGKKTIKTAEKAVTKTTQKTVKTAERTAKTAIKTTQQTASAAKKTAQATVKASQRAAQVAKVTAKAVATGIKAAVKATIAAVKAAIAGIKALVAAIVVGGWVAVIIIIVICLIALICGSVFGVFFSGEDSGSGQTMRTAVQEINADYDSQLESAKNGTAHDVLEMSGSHAVWKEVLAVYSVKVNTDPDNPQEVATMDDTKKQLLKDIFWEMNSITSRSESKTETKITETDDGHGNIVQTEFTVKRTYLYITVAHKTVEEMAAQYGFNQEQKDYLTELLKDENNSDWNALIYGFDSQKPIDISLLNFANESANEKQKKVVTIAINSDKYGIVSNPGYCQAWVADVYQIAVGNRGYAVSALSAGKKWSVSKDWSKIQVGATIYGYANNQYGHVGIYIGNGMVAHNLSGDITVQSLESWITQFKGICWGWENGNNLTGDSQYNCIGGLI